MNCPKCRQQSLKTKYVSGANINVDYCPKCQGIWFDGGELAQALGGTDPQLQIPGGAVRLQAPCPRCTKPLYAFGDPQTRVVVEMCRACGGLWLDVGEFQQIRASRAQPSQGEEPAPEAEVGGIKVALLSFIDAAIEQLPH